MLKPVIDESIFEPIKVIEGMKPEVGVEVNIDDEIMIPKGKEHSIDNSMEVVSEINAPVKKGQSLGRLIYKLNDEIIAEYDIIAAESIDAINFGSVFHVLINGFFKI